MAKIIPSILTDDFEEIRNKIQQSTALGATEVQLDICDGVFVPSQTWPYANNDAGGELARILNEEEGLPLWSQLDYELDLMVSMAHEQFALYLKLGAKRIIFHLEAEGDTAEFKEFLEGIDLVTRDFTKIGVSIDIATPVETVFPLLPYVDFIQCMGIDHEGAQGEEFNPEVIEKIRAIHVHESDIEISIDGGVNLENASLLIDAGASRLMVGSALWKSPNPADTFRKLQEIAGN